MNFGETKLRGAYIVELETLEDERGFFARSYCREEFEEHGLVPGVVQANLSFNGQMGTIRGMHYQIAPHEEAKLVRCTRGSLYDVIIDLKPHSSTYMQWFGIELTAANYRMLYVPENFAHGFQTLEDNTEVTYQVSESYHPTAERGVRYNDPAFGIRWPIPASVISEKDGNWPGFGR